MVGGLFVYKTQAKLELKGVFDIYWSAVGYLYFDIFVWSWYQNRRHFIRFFAKFGVIWEAEWMEYSPAPLVFDTVFQGVPKFFLGLQSLDCQETALDAFECCCSC